MHSTIPLLATDRHMGPHLSVWIRAHTLTDTGGHAEVAIGRQSMGGATLHYRVPDQRLIDCRFRPPIPTELNAPKMQLLSKNQKRTVLLHSTVCQSRSSARKENENQTKRGIRRAAVSRGYRRMATGVCTLPCRRQHARNWTVDQASYIELFTAGWFGVKKNTISD